MKYRILSKTEMELYGANVLAVIDNTDLAALGAGNTGSFYVAPYVGGIGTTGLGVSQPYVATANNSVTLPAGNICRLVAMVLDTAFVFSDATLTAAGVTVGDGGSAARYLASTETNAAGSSVAYAAGTGTRFALTSADNIIAAFTGTSAKNLNTCTAGSMRLFLRIEDLSQLPSS